MLPSFTGGVVPVLPLPPLPPLLPLPPESPPLDPPVVPRTHAVQVCVEVMVKLVLHAKLRVFTESNSQLSPVLQTPFPQYPHSPSMQVAPLSTLHAMFWDVGLVPVHEYSVRVAASMQRSVLEYVCPFVSTPLTVPLLSLFTPPSVSVQVPA